LAPSSSQFSESWGELGSGDTRILSFVSWGVQNDGGTTTPTTF